MFGLGLGFGMRGGAVGDDEPASPIVGITTAWVSMFLTAAGIGLLPAQLDFDVDAAAITLGAAMFTTGSGTPPAVTLTGTLAFGAGLLPGLRVECNSVAGGPALGQAFFRVSYDSGVTWALAGSGGQVTAATVDLDGAAAGVTLNFATGTYGTDHVWEGMPQTILTSEGSAYTFTQATSTARRIFRHRDSTADGKEAGKASLYAPSGTRWYECTDAPALALMTDDPPLTIMGCVSYAAADANGTWLGVASSAEGTNRKRRVRQSNTSAGAGIRINHAAANNAGGTANNVPNTDHSITTEAHVEVYKFPGSNGGITMRIDGVAVTPTSSTANIGTLTPTRLVIGGDADSTPGDGHLGHIYRTTLHSSDVSGDDLTAWETELAA